MNGRIRKYNVTLGKRVYGSNFRANYTCYGTGTGIDCVPGARVGVFGDPYSTDDLKEIKGRSRLESIERLLAGRPSNRCERP